MMSSIQYSTGARSATFLDCLSASMVELRSATREQRLFYIAFGLCAFCTLMVRTTFESVFGIPKELFILLGYAVSALLLGAKLFMERCASWQFYIALALVVLCFISFWIADAWRFSVLFLFIAAGKNVSVKHLALIALCLQLVVLIPTLAFAFSGHIYSFTVYRLVDGTWMPRLSYGYSHPNMLGQVFVVIGASYAVLRFPHFRPEDMLVYGLAGLGAAVLVRSRTAVAALILVAMLAFLAPRIVQSKASMRAFSLMALVLFCAFVALSFFMMLNYDSEVAWMNTLDTFLSQRFTMAHRFFEIFPPTAWGRDLMAVKVEDFLQDAPDNAYVRALIKQGIIPSMVLGLLVFAALLGNVRRGVWNASVAGLVVYAFVGLMEMYATNFTLNYCLIACAWVLYGIPQGENDVREGEKSKGLNGMDGAIHIPMFGGKSR